MPRLPRLFVPGAFYHVTTRGNHRQDLFFRAADRRLLDGFLAEALEPCRARLHAYCWMTNHLHLLVQVSDVPLGRLMQRIGTRFARAIQRQIPTNGHLFQNRYHALLVDADAYFLELLRYIHLNPVRAGIVRTPDEYRWSSHGTYLGNRPRSWVTTDFGLSLFGTDLEIARLRYVEFINERVGQPSEPSLYQGHPKEKRVLGDDHFLARLSIPIRRRPIGVTFESLAQQVCDERGLTLDQLRGPSAVRSYSLARGLLAARAVDQRIATLSDVARFLNRSVSAVSRLALRYAEVAKMQT